MNQPRLVSRGVRVTLINPSLLMGEVVLGHSKSGLIPHSKVFPLFCFSENRSLTTSFHLPKNMLLSSLVGLAGNLSLLEIVLYAFPGVEKPTGRIQEVSA